MDITVDLGQVMAAFDSADATSEDRRWKSRGKETEKKSVAVYDVWARKQLGSFAETFTATNVPHHGTAFLRLTPTAFAR